MNKIKCLNDEKAHTKNFEFKSNDVAHRPLIVAGGSSVVACNYDSDSQVCVCVCEYLRII